MGIFKRALVALISLFWASAELFLVHGFVDQQHAAPHTMGDGPQDPRVPRYDESHQILMGPVSIIDGCVNAVTGTFFDVETDLDVAGTCLNLTRNYCSGTGAVKPLSAGDYKNEGFDLFRCWSWNHSTLLYWRPHWDVLSIGNATSGVKDIFSLEKSVKRRGRIHPTQFRGWVNASHGFLGGCTDLHNQKVEFYPDASDSWVVTMEDGTERIFGWRSFSDGKKEKQHWYTHERQRNYPNGLRSIYTHSQPFQLESVKLESRLQNCLIGSIQRKSITEFATSHTQGVKYYLKDYQGGYDGVLYKVERSHKPSIQYDYDQFVWATFTWMRNDRNKKIDYCIYNNRYVPFLRRKTLPDGRFVEITYHDGFPKLWVTNGKIKGRFQPDANAGKVTALIAPLDGTGKGIVKYSFNYEGEKTTVTDACQGVQEFYFDSEKRIKTVLSRGHNGQKLERQYRWGQGVKEGYLKCQWACDEKGEVNYYKRFEYDDQGNVIAEWMHGNLTGRGAEVKLNQAGELIESGEMCCRRYEYSQDRFHCLTREIYRDGREIQYIYEPGSSLPMARLERLNGRIVKRTFQSYDDFANLSLVIEDDGSGENPDDYTDVRVRRLSHQRAYESGPEIGLIFEKTSSFWDPELQRLVTLSRSQYTYYPTRQVKTRTVWTSGCSEPSEYYYEYDAHGNITLERLPNGSEIVRKYDANDNKIFESGPDHRLQTHLKYDTMNRLVEKCEHHSDGQWVTHYEYDLMGKLIQETSPYGVVRKISYDAFGRAVQVEMPVQIDSDGQASSSMYLEKYKYDSFGRMIEKVDALGYCEKYAYNCFDQLTYESKQGQVATRHYYDLEGRKVQTQMETGSTESYQYDSLGRKTAMLRYDDKGQLVFSQEYIYEGMLLAQVNDSTGRCEKYHYDGAGRMIEKAIIEGELVLQREQWSYDGQDRVLCHRQYANDQDYVDRLCRYDNMGRLCECKRYASNGALIGHETYEFDGSGRVVRETKVSDGRREEKHMEYDSHGALTSVVDALGYSWLYQYQRACPYKGKKLDCLWECRPDGTRKQEWRTWTGQIAESKVYAMDGTLAYEAYYGYDAYNGITYRFERTLASGKDQDEPVVTRVRFGPARKVLERVDAAESPHQRVTRWQYNRYGLLESVTLPSGLCLHYSYDSFGLLQRVWSTDATVDQHWKHDAYGNAIEVSQLDGTITRRSYNALGQVIGEDVHNGEFGYRYRVFRQWDGLGRLLRLQLPLGVEVERNYDKSFLRSVKLKGSLGAYEHHYLEYDGSGRVLREGLVGSAGEIRRSYDALGRVDHLVSDYFESRITSFDSMGRVRELERGFDQSHHLSFSYDALGQLTQEIMDSQCVSYSHNSRQQRLAKDETLYFHNSLSELLQVVGDQTHSLVYDFDGRLIQFSRDDRTYSLSYDAWNRLTQVACDNGERYQYFYDGFDRRIGKRVVSSDGSVQDYQYIYDDQFELGCIQNDQWKELRLVGLRSQAETGDTLLVIIDSKAYATILDLQGSIVGWVDLTTREIAATCEYDAFGIAQGEVLGPWGYICKRQDLETGWIFYGKRYYIPEYGRWLTKDPKGEIDGSNLYAFLRNNPVYQWDLWGLSASIGVTRPVFVNLTGRDVSPITSEIEATFAKFQDEYPEKTYNACVIAVIKDENLPWKGFLNGICNEKDECVGRLTEYAKTCNVNMISIYNASMGFEKDIAMVTNRNDHGNDVFRPEYKMAGAMYDVGLNLNSKLNINRFDTLAHSNGESVGFAGTNWVSNPSELKYIYLHALGGVGDKTRADKTFDNYTCDLHERDGIALSARTRVFNDYVKYVCTGPKRGWSWDVHAIDKVWYRDLAMKFLEKPYASSRSL